MSVGRKSFVNEHERNVKSKKAGSEFTGFF
jgi:hypothetical protein